MRQNEQFVQAFTTLGNTPVISDELFQVLNKFTCFIYAPSSKTTHVDQLRYEMFYAKRGEVESNLLPPCADCLRKHIMRANYQSSIWKCCLQRNPTIPGPEGHGWIKDVTGSLSIDWMDGVPAPDAILEMMACHCKITCESGSCLCMDNGFRCTPMCRKQDCSNQREEDTLPEVIEFHDSDDDRDDY